MVDSGSDFDAIDLDLAAHQRELGNPAFLRRDVVAKQPVSGFGRDMEQSTNSQSEWAVTLTGSNLLGGPTVNLACFSHIRGAYGNRLGVCALSHNALCISTIECRRDHAEIHWGFALRAIFKILVEIPIILRSLVSLPEVIMSFHCLHLL